MGINIAKTVIAATGLPTDPVEREFNKLLSKHGTTAEEMTIEDLREIVAEYLQTVILELAEQDEHKSA